MPIKLYGNYIAVLKIKKLAQPEIITTSVKANAKNYSPEQLSKILPYLEEYDLKPTVG